MTSEVLAQKKRPTILNRLINPTKPAAAAGVTLPVNISWIMGEACPNTPMPAVTFIQSTPHNSQNCGVRQATSNSTLAAVTSFFACAEGTQPAGFQPSAGTRTVNTPII